MAARGNSQRHVVESLSSPTSYFRSNQAAYTTMTSHEASLPSNTISSAFAHHHSSKWRLNRSQFTIVNHELKKKSDS